MRHYRSRKHPEMTAKAWFVEAGEPLPDFLAESFRWHKVAQDRVCIRNKITGYMVFAGDMIFEVNGLFLKATVDMFAACWEPIDEAKEGLAA